MNFIFILFIFIYLCPLCLAVILSPNDNAIPCVFDLILI